MTENYDFFISKIKLLSKEVDFRITFTREMILKVIFHSQNPICVKHIVQILFQDHNISVSSPSVYKILNILEKYNILQSISYKSNKTKHYFIVGHKSKSHLICLKCRKILTFYDNIMEEELRKMLDKIDFVLINHKITLYGICKDCLIE